LFAPPRRAGRLTGVSARLWTLNRVFCLFPVLPGGARFLFFTFAHSIFSGLWVPPDVVRSFLFASLAIPLVGPFFSFMLSFFVPFPTCGHPRLFLDFFHFRFLSIWAEFFFFSPVFFVSALPATNPLLGFLHDHFAQAPFSFLVPLFCLFFSFYLPPPLGRFFREAVKFPLFFWWRLSRFCTSTESSPLSCPGEWTRCFPFFSGH